MIFLDIITRDINGIADKIQLALDSIILMINNWSCLEKQYKYCSGIHSKNRACFVPAHVLLSR